MVLHTFSDKMLPVPTLSLAPPLHWLHPFPGPTLSLALPSPWSLLSFQPISALVGFPTWSPYTIPAMVPVAHPATQKLLGQIAGSCRARLGSQLQH